MLMPTLLKPTSLSRCAAAASSSQPLVFIETFRPLFRGVFGDLVQVFADQRLTAAKIDEGHLLFNQDINNPLDIIASPAPDILRHGCNNARR